MAVSATAQVPSSSSGQGCQIEASITMSLKMMLVLMVLVLMLVLVLVLVRVRVTMLMMATKWTAIIMMKMMEGAVTTQHHPKQQHLDRHKASRNCNTKFNESQTPNLPAPKPSQALRNRPTRPRPKPDIPGVG